MFCSYEQNMYTNDIEGKKITGSPPYCPLPTDYSPLSILYLVTGMSEPPPK